LNLKYFLLKYKHYKKFLAVIEACFELGIKKENHNEKLTQKGSNLRSAEIHK